MQSYNSGVSADGRVPFDSPPRVLDHLEAPEDAEDEGGEQAKDGVYERLVDKTIRKG